MADSVNTDPLGTVAPSGEAQLTILVGGGAMIKDMPTGLIAGLAYVNMFPSSAAADSLRSFGLDSLIFSKQAETVPEIIVPVDPGDPGDVVPPPDPVDPPDEEVPPPDPDPDPTPPPVEGPATFGEWIGIELAKPLQESYTFDNYSNTIKASLNETLGSASDTRVMAFHAKWNGQWYALSVSQFVALLYRGHAMGAQDGVGANVQVIDLDRAFTVSYGEQFVLFMIRVANNNHPGLTANSTLVPVAALYNRDAVVAGTYPVYVESPSSDDPSAGYSVVVTNVTSAEIRRDGDSGGDMVTREWIIKYAVTKGTFSTPPPVLPTSTTRGELSEAMARGVKLNYCAPYEIRYYSNNRWNEILDPMDLLRLVSKSDGVLAWLDSHSVRHSSSMSTQVQGTITRQHVYYAPDDSNPSGMPL